MEENEMQNNAQNNVQNNVQGTAQEDKGQGLSIAAMILGIISLVLLLFQPYIGLVCGIVGLVFSIMRLKKEKYKGMAITGLITSLITIIIVVLITLFAVFAAATFMSALM